MLRLQFAALQAATSVPPLEHVRVAPGGGFFWFFTTYSAGVVPPLKCCKKFSPAACFFATSLCGKRDRRFFQNGDGRLRSAVLRLQFAALQAATSVPPLEHVRVAPGGGVFLFFAAIKLPQQPRNRTAPPNIADSTKSGVRGEKNAVTHLSFPDAEPAVKDLIPLSAEKRGEEANILPHPPTPPPSMPPDHHRTPSNGAPGCRGRRKPPAKRNLHNTQNRP